MKDDVLEFLQQSNLIENEPSYQALDDAIAAWKYIVTKPILTKVRILHLHRMLMKTRRIEPQLIGAYRFPVDNLTGDVMVGGKTKAKWATVPNLMQQWIINANDLIINGQREHREFLKEMVQQHHVKFEDIHPFIDGNGRIGRILMNWQLIKLGFQIKIIREEDKLEYYKWFA